MLAEEIDRYDERCPACGKFVDREDCYVIPPAPTGGLHRGCCDENCAGKVEAHEAAHKEEPRPLMTSG